MGWQAKRTHAALDFAQRMWMMPHRPPRRRWERGACTPAWRAQRLKAYTFAQWRLREEMELGRPGARVLMGVVGEARVLFHLSAEEWRALARALACSIHASVDE